MRIGSWVITYSLNCIRQGPAHLGGRIWLFLLSMVSWLYSPLVRLRGLAYSLGWMPQRRLPVPVISVGNISLGGTGKTPLVERIARAVSEEKKRVAILIRGYRGSSEAETVVVSDGTRLLSRPAEAGDEAYLLAKRLPSVAVVAGKDRYRAGSLAITDLGAQSLVLDDGFQHRSLKRDLDIVSIDASEPFGYGHLFPRGLLREPLESLSRADVLVIIRAKADQDLEEIRGRLRRYNPQAALFVGERRPLSFMKMPEESQHRLEEIRGWKCVAFSGIANPPSFLALLSSLGAEVMRSFSFPDHHPYRLEELGEIVGWAKEAGVQALLTTEKDSIRLPQDLYPLPIPLYYLRMEIQLSQEKEFFSLVRGVGRAS